MIKFEEYKSVIPHSGFEIDSHYLESIYKEICINKMSSYFHVFLGEKIKNGMNYSTEDLYNWCITLQTIFNIKEEKTK